MNAPFVSAKPGEALTEGGCPVEYRSVKASQYDAAAQQDALSGRFKVHGELLDLRPPIDWRQDPIHSRAFKARLADLAFLDALIFVYLREEASPADRRKALRMALGIVEDWIAAEAKGRVSGETWTDRVVARRATFIAFIARAAACEQIVRGGDASALFESVTKHGNWLRDPLHYKRTNHGLSIDLALAALGRYFPGDAQLTVGARLGERRYKRTFFASFQRGEGVWLEHSMGYWDYAIHLIDDYLRVVDATDADLLVARGQLVSSLAWLTAPDGRLAQFGDTNFESPRTDVRVEAGAQDGLWVAPKSGYAVVKDRLSGGWLAIATAYHSGVHKHSDELSFELYEHGQRVVQDTGTYHKDHDRYFRFQTSAAAHSTLLVDGRGQDSEQGQPYGSGLVASGVGAGWYGVLAENPLVGKQGVQHLRLFLYGPRQALLVIDLVRSSHRHTYTRYFQLGAKLDVSREADTLFLSSRGFRGALTSSSSVGPGQLVTVAGQDDPLAGWTYLGFREAKPRTTARWRTRGSTVDHLATFSLGADPVDARLGPVNGSSVSVSLRDSAGNPLGTLSTHVDGADLTIALASP